jgi:Zn finger protein HypA/HybF involved in hydrogenase expression
MNERLERAMRATKERMIFHCYTCGFATIIPLCAFIPDCPKCKSNATSVLENTGNVQCIRAGVAATYNEETYSE